MIGIIQKCLLFCQSFDFTKSFTMYSIDDVSCFNVDVTSCWIACHMSFVTCHMSQVMCHMSHVLFHMSLDMSSIVQHCSESLMLAK